MHPELRPRLVQSAQEQGTNLTEVAVKILAERYQFPYEPNGGRRTSPLVDQDVLNLQLPDRLAQRIKLSSTRARSGTWMDDIRRTLCSHYGLSVPAKPAPVRSARR